MAFGHLLSSECPVIVAEGRWKSQRGGTGAELDVRRLEERPNAKPDRESRLLDDPSPDFELQDASLNRWIVLGDRKRFVVALCRDDRHGTRRVAPRTLQDDFALRLHVRHVLHVPLVGLLMDLFADPLRAVDHEHDRMRDARHRISVAIRHAASTSIRRATSIASGSEGVLERRRVRAAVFAARRRGTGMARA